MRSPVLAIAVGLVAAALASAAPREPVPLRGAPLPHDSGLQLLVADRRPFVLDVDSGRAQPVTGMPELEYGVLWVVGLAGGTGIVVAQSAADAHLYAIRRGGRATALGTGRAVTPAADGRSVWIKSRDGRSRCTLRRVRIDGRQLRAPKPFPCATTIQSGGSAGLIVSRTRLIDPLTGRTVMRTTWGMLAAARDELLLAGPGKQFTLLDTANGTERRVQWPSILDGLDHIAVAPDGRLIAVGFADPSWQLTGAQVSDVWLLDTRSNSWSQLPGLPAFVSLKSTSMAWTADGRLVFLGEDERRGFVAQWRPGQPRLAVKRVRLPQRSSGSDSFAPLR